MKTIFIIILFILAGLFFGFMFSRFFIWLSNKLLSRKTRKEILKKGLSEEELRRRNFYFRKDFYNIAKVVEDDLKNYKPWYKKIFQKKVKGGISDYGNQPTNAGNPGLERKQVPTVNEGTSTTADNGKQGNTTTPPSDGQGRNTTRNLFKKGKKFY